MTATKQSGGLPERHKAHLSWPPIAKNIITIINNAMEQFEKCTIINKHTRKKDDEGNDENNVRS